jgi:hypothetical protein
MVEEYRHPSLIQEELSDVQRLLRKEKELISLYPDHTELIFLHETSKQREEHLVKELKIVLDRLQLDSFDMVFKGEAVRGNSISLLFLGKFASTFQDTVRLIAQSQNKTIGLEETELKKPVKEGYSLDVLATCAGSFRVILSSHQPAIDESLVKISLKRLNRLIDCGDNRNLIKEEIKDLGIKTIIKYKGLLGTLYKNKVDIKLYDKMIPKDFETKEITRELAKSIYEAIEREENVPEQEMTLQGTIKGISLLSNKIEFIIDESGKKIEAKFSKSMEPDVKEGFDKSSVAKFRVSKQWNEIKEEFKEKWVLVGLN